MDDGTILIEPYDPEGARRAAILIGEISAALGARLLALEHIGSTAVPQLASKPIIDLNGMLDSFVDIDAAIPILTELGSNWHYVPTELDQPTWQRFLVKIVDGHRSCHLHLLPKDSERWDEHLIFGMHSEKTQSDREAYTEAKTLFVRATIGID